MNYQQHLANSAAIRTEIQRFESVHPNIYSIYELLERVEEPLLQNQIREHVIAIEGKECPQSSVLSPQHGAVHGDVWDHTPKHISCWGNVVIMSRSIHDRPDGM